MCEDVRDETGNKKSLMGVFGGDILVPNFPAAIQFAVYFQYIPKNEDPQQFEIKVRLLQGEVEVGKGRFGADRTELPILTMVLPRGIILFEKPTTLKLLAAVHDSPEVEILTKQIREGAVT